MTGRIVWPESAALAESMRNERKKEKESNQCRSSHGWSTWHRL